jgi:hypothetical protein
MIGSRPTYIVVGKKERDPWPAYSEEFVSVNQALLLQYHGLYMECPAAFVFIVAFLVKTAT